MTRAHELDAIRWIPALSAADIASPRFRILIHQRVLREVQKRILTGRAEESAGLLLGEAVGEPGDAAAHVLVDRFLPSVDPVPEDADAATLGNVLRPLLEAASLAGKTVGGWYRGHALLGPSLSEDEVWLHQRWFEASWQFALIGLADPARPGGAIFARTREGHLAPVPFHELLDRDAILPDGRKATSLTWRNYRTMEAVVRPGESREAPPEPRAPPVEAPPALPMPPIETPPEPEAPPVEAPPEPRAPPVEAPPESEAPPVEPPPEPRAPPVEAPPESEAPPVEPRTPAFEMTPGPPEPAEPDRPAEPTGPIEPTRPTEPDRPAEPTGPVEPTRPAEPDRPAKPTRPAASGGGARPPKRPASPVARGSGKPPIARGQPLIVLPDAVRSGPRPWARRLAGLAALALLAAGGWWAWNQMAPERGAGGETAGSPEAPDTIEFAVPGPEEGAGTEREGTSEPERSPASERPATSDAAAGEAAGTTTGRPEPEAGRSPPAVPLPILADRVFEAVEAYEETRYVFNRGRADCRELRAAHARAARAFRELSERFAALRGRVGPAAEAEYRRAAAGMDEVERHLAASDCPE